MPIILNHPLSEQEIRVLQEFRRLTKETLASDSIQAIRHPTGGGEAPALKLVEKGYLTTDGSSATFTLTAKARDFLAIDPKP